MCRWSLVQVFTALSTPPNRSFQVSDGTADLEDVDVIQTHHPAEALQYRTRVLDLWARENGTAVAGKVDQGLATLVCQDGTLTHSAPFVVHCIDRGHGGHLTF